MNIIAVDDEQIPLNELMQAIRKAVPSANLSGFTQALHALEYAKRERVDVAFLDVRMENMDGLELGEKLRAIHRQLNLIYVTGYREYTSEAYYLHASGYVDKPVTPAAIRYEMEILKNRLVDDEKPKIPQKLGPYTFDHAAGRVYENGRDTLLSPREYRLFCLLADNLGICFTPEEIYKTIWREDPNDNVRTVYKHISTLRTKLQMDEDNGYDIETKRKSGYRLIQL